MFRTIWIICVCAGCSRPVVFEEDTAIWVIAPSQSTPHAAVGQDAIVVWGDLEFTEDSTISPASLDVLNEVASLSRSNPAVKKIIVEKPQLSQPQVTAVLAYLVQRGVANDVEISCVRDQARAMTSTSPTSPASQATSDSDDEENTHVD